jgi:hypothetical protein
MTSCPEPMVYSLAFLTSCITEWVVGHPCVDVRGTTRVRGGGCVCVRASEASVKCHSVGEMRSGCAVERQAVRKHSRCKQRGAQLTLTNVGVPVQIGFLLGWALGSGLPLHSAAMAPVATSKRPGRSSQPKSSVQDQFVAIVSELCECECACACMRGDDVSTFMCTGEDK